MPLSRPAISDSTYYKTATWSWFTVLNSRSRCKQHRRTGGLASPIPSATSDDGSRDGRTGSDGAKREASAAVALYHNGRAPSLAHSVGGGTRQGESDEARERKEKFSVEMHDWKSRAELSFCSLVS